MEQILSLQLIFLLLAPNSSDFKYRFDWFGQDHYDICRVCSVTAGAFLVFVEPQASGIVQGQTDHPTSLEPGTRGRTLEPGSQRDKKEKEKKKIYSYTINKVTCVCCILREVSKDDSNISQYFTLRPWYTPRSGVST